MDLLLSLLATDPVPEPEDVRAGWTAFWVFVALIAATALLLWSFTRQLRKTRANAEKGVFDPSDPGRQRRGFAEERQPDETPRDRA